MSMNLNFALHQLKSELLQGNQKGGALVKEIEMNFELKPNTLTPYYPVLQLLFLHTKEQFMGEEIRKVKWTDEEQDVYALYSQDVKDVKKQYEFAEELAGLLQRAVPATSQAYYSKKIAIRDVKYLRKIKHEDLQPLENEEKQMTMSMQEEKPVRKEIVTKEEKIVPTAEAKEVTETKQVSSSSEGLIIPAEITEELQKWEQIKKILGGDSEKEKQLEGENKKLKEDIGKLQTNLEITRGKLTDVRMENIKVNKEKQDLERQNEYLHKCITEMDVYMNMTKDAYDKAKTFINVQPSQKPESLKYQVDYKENSVVINK